MKSFVGNALLVGLALAAGVVGGCSAQSGAPAVGAEEGTGSIGMQLQFGPGASLSTLSWTIHNPALLAADKTGTVDVSHSQAIQFIVGGLPAGGGYTITLTGVTDGAHPVNCLGTATFSITAGATSTANVSLVCGSTAAVDAGNNGSVIINGTVTLAPSCAAVTSLSASPSRIDVGSSLLLAATGVDGSGVSTGVGFAWTVSGVGAGSFSSTTAASPTFLCTAAGPVTVTVTASVSSSMCTNNTASVSLTCDAPAGSPGVDAGVDSGHEAGVDASVDAGVDSGHEAGVDASVDAGVDSGADAGVDSGHEAGVDASVDAGVDSGVDAGVDSGHEAGVDAGVDSGVDAAVDSGHEAGVDAAAEAAADAARESSAPSACAAFNAGAGCTATEQKFVNKSVDCYSCLVNGSCLNDSLFGDINKECDDLPGNASGGARAGTANSKLCLDKIDCIITTSCASSDVATCYCGTLLGSACATSSAPGNGACAQAEADGSNHLVTEPASLVSPTLADVTLPSGKADAIFACANLNGCAALCSQ